ncbi:MAG: YcnI family protein, partial [Actinomycetota bacterium]
MRINRHEPDRRAGRRAATLAGVAAGLWLGTSPARAHVYVEPREQLPGRLGTLGFTVPHGCGESPTTRLDIAVPEGVDGVEPQPHEGWQAEVVTDPATGRASKLSWSGASLPSHEETVFTARARFPDRPGERLWFKVVQTCAEGETRWVELPAAGQDPNELAHPAAHVDLVDPSAPAAAPDGGEVST